MFSFFKKEKIKRIRVKANVGEETEKFVTLKIDQSFDLLEILSLKLSNSEIYSLFDSEYGVLVGRAIGNEGVGIPNCKISVFIPINERDKNNEINSIEDLHKSLVESVYPYETVLDENGDGLRYNLLPKYSRNRGFNGFPANDFGIGATPKTPVGNFLEKENFLVNPVYLYVYENYYKFSTVTNESGDYMLVLPKGQHQIHLDCDLTDIGRWSLSPLLMSKVLNYPDSLFNEEGSTIKPSKDLNNLPHIQSQDLVVNVKSLWSQRNNSDEIGITRQDFKIKGDLKPHFALFGSFFTMSKSSWWGDIIKFRLHLGLRNICWNLIGSDCGNNVTACESTIIWEFRPPRIGIRFKIAGNEISIGDPNRDGITFEPNICFYVQIANILPFFRIEFGNDYCKLDGGRFNSSPLDIINHGKTCACSVEQALQEIPKDGINDSLFLNNHRITPASIKLFTLNNNINDVEANAINQEYNLPNDNPLLNLLDSKKQITLMSDDDYVKVIKDGEFGIQALANRKKMITTEDGRLVETDNPNRGVFTEFRGYLYMVVGGEIDDSKTKRRTARIALKIPQRFDYDKNPLQWIFSHGIFQAGNIYSVSQKIATKNSHFSKEQEKAIDLNNFDTDKKGWESQSGIILMVDDSNHVGNNPTVINSENILQGSTMSPNHITEIGDDEEYDYNYSEYTGTPSNDNINSGNGTTGAVFYGFKSNNGINVTKPTINEHIFENDIYTLEWIPSAYTGNVNIFIHYDIDKPIVPPPILLASNVANTGSGILTKIITIPTLPINFTSNSTKCQIEIMVSNNIVVNGKSETFNYFKL